MAFDFPPNPPIGHIYTSVDGALFSWDGEKWMKGSGVAAVSGGYVLKAGDTMLGFLTANADPTDPLHYATKQYVDQLFAPLGTPGQALVINPTNVPTWGAPIDGENF